MPTEPPTTDSRVTVASAVRHHLGVVLVLLALGGLAGWAYTALSPTTYSSTARVLVNPSVGNPYTPTPASVRQDEQTSLETEAQVAASAEVLDAVAEQLPGLTSDRLENGLAISVPANTQILEISFTAQDPIQARQVADALATAYLDNRVRRFEEANAERIDRVETQTLRVVDDLRTATAAAQVGTAADRSFQAQLADALRIELVNLRAQRTALENSESPAGAVISPASSATRVGATYALLVPAGGALAGLALGCAAAVGLERARGVIRSVREVEAAGLPVLAAVPSPGWRTRLFRKADDEGFDTTIRRLRATVLDMAPGTGIIAVAPPGSGPSDTHVTEAVAESFARAGHRVVLVRTDGKPSSGWLGIEERGLAQALLEQLNVLDLLQPSVEPLLNVLPPGRSTPQSQELLAADRLRTVLSPLTDTGHLVVIQAPGIDTAVGEAVIGASDLALVVVTTGDTQPREVVQVTRHARHKGPTLAGVVVDRRSRGRHTSRTSRFGSGHHKDTSPADGSDHSTTGAGPTAPELVRGNPRPRTPR